jgi:hypothetical protein
MSRTPWIVAALLVAGGAAVGLTRRRAAPPTASVGAASAPSAASESASSSSSNAPEASVTPWPDHPLTYDCSTFTPKSLPVAATTAEGPVGVLLRRSRWRSASAIACAAGVQLDEAGYTELDRAITQLAAKAPASLTPLARAAAQNAALGVARCARPAEGVQGAPTAARITTLKHAARSLAHRLALDDAALTTLDTAFPSPLSAWTGGAPPAGDADAPQSTDLHARSRGYTVATRALPSIDGANAYYGELVVIDSAGKARVLDVPATLVLRKTTENGLTLCFADLADPDAYPAPTLLPAPPPQGSAAYGPVSCQRCHTRGRRLSEVSRPIDGPRDARGLEDLAAWYRAKSD